MLRLNRYILALVLWISFLFNIERLSIGSAETLNIAAPVYLVAIAAVVIGFLLPHWLRAAVWLTYTTVILSFVVAKLLDARSVWGQEYTYLLLFELSAVLITATLAHMVGRLSADFIETVRALVFTGMAGPIYEGEEAQQVIKRELQYSRRVDRPLSVIVVEPNSEGVNAELHATAREIQQLLVQRYSLIAVIRLLAWKIRRTDSVLYQTDEGRLVLIAPKASKDQTIAIVARLNEYVQRHLGVTLRCGVASFPNEGVTFEELITRAEHELDSKMHTHDSQMPVARRETATEESRVIGYQRS